MRPVGYTPFVSAVKNTDIPRRHVVIDVILRAGETRYQSEFDHTSLHLRRKRETSCQNMLPDCSGADESWAVHWTPTLKNVNVGIAVVCFAATWPRLACTDVIFRAGNSVSRQMGVHRERKVDKEAMV